jgi:dihydrofolate synthase/folylpolyglutamate synthase
MTLGLANMRALMDRLGHPERRFRAVLVAGTNGKGSVTTLLASILCRHGLRTGRYLSPHVFSVAERIAVDGEAVSLEEMEAAAALVAPLHGEIPFSYFEALTAMAFLVFAERRVEVAVLEVGLGGRFDATNVVEPEVSVVTSISLDHRRILGDTEEEILREKLGVARSGVPLLVGALPPALRAVADERAARGGLPIFGPAELGEATVVEEFLGGIAVRVRTPRSDYGTARVRIGGRHQAVNVLLAVGAAERMLPALDRVVEGLESAAIAGRFQCLERGGRIFVLDVAHNDAALRATADHLAAFRPREECAIVFGLLRRKELFEAPRRLVRAAAGLCLVEPGAEAGSADLAFPPHELLALYFAPLLPNTATDVMLWNRMDGGDGSLARVTRWLDGDGRRFKVVLATGSHRVVDEFGGRILAHDDAIGSGR